MADGRYVRMTEKVARDEHLSARDALRPRSHSAVVAVRYSCGKGPRYVHAAAQMHLRQVEYTMVAYVAAETS